MQVSAAIPAVLEPSAQGDSARIAERASLTYAESMRTLGVRTDRMFAWLMLVQWVAGILASVLISPRTWAGIEPRVHIHVWAALLLGGLISSGPVILVLTRPGRTFNRYVIASAQMLWSALLIHLTGG